MFSLHIIIMNSAGSLTASLFLVQLHSSVMGTGLSPRQKVIREPGKEGVEDECMMRVKSILQWVTRQPP